MRRALDAAARILGVALAGPGSAQTARVTCQNGEVPSVIARDDLAVIATPDMGEDPEGIDAAHDKSGIVVAGW